jgi:hypothetical protein
LGKKLAKLSAEVKQIHGYDWGERPDKPNKIKLPKTPKLKTPNLCANCKTPKSKKLSVVADYLTNQIEW